MHRRATRYGLFSMSDIIGEINEYTAIYLVLVILGGFHDGIIGVRMRGK